MQCHSDGSINFVIHFFVFIFFLGFLVILDYLDLLEKLEKLEKVYLTSEYIRASLQAKTGA